MTPQQAANAANEHVARLIDIASASGWTVCSVENTAPCQISLMGTRGVRVTIYATENVVPPTADELEAMQAWLDAIRWAAPDEDDAA